MTNMSLISMELLVRHFGGKEAACQCRYIRDSGSIRGLGRHKRHGRLRFDPWVGKIPWSRKWQPTPVFLPGEARIEEPGGLQFMGSQKSQTWLSD